MNKLNKLEALTTLLGQQEIEALKFLVRKAEVCSSQHLAWVDNRQANLKMEGCDVEFHRREFLDRHSAVEALASLGFVSFRTTGDTQIQPKYHLTLFPAATHRVKYEGRSTFGKKSEVWTQKYKDVMTVIAFCVSLALAVIKVIEVINGP